MLSDFLLFGEPYKLIIKRFKKKYLINVPKKIILVNPDYKKDFLNYLERTLKKYAKYILIRQKRELGLKFTIKISVRLMRDTLGYINIKQGEICINLLLVTFPRRLIRYILTHELLHFLIAGHNKLFRHLLYYVWPDYKELERDLRRYLVIIKNNETISGFLISP